MGGVKMVWKKVKRNQNYSVNELGCVRNDNTGKTKAPFINPSNNYLTIDLWKDNRSQKVTIHRLIAEAFIPNPQNKPCVDHKDGNRQNNSIDNLRWCTYSENNSRFSTIGVRSEKIIVTKYAEKRNPRGGGHIAWLEEPVSVSVYSRIKDVSEYLKCSQSNITTMLKSGNIGKRGKMRGYKFEYLDR